MDFKKPHLTHKWSIKELEYLKRYEKFINLNLPIEMGLDERIKRKIMYLEACLLIINKTLIAYHNNESLGIFYFSELSDVIDRFNKNGEIVTYHPINFKNMKEFVRFLEKPYD